MSHKVKYAMVGLLAMLMLAYMTGFAAEGEKSDSKVTGTQIVGPYNTNTEYKEKDRKAPASVLVGIDTLEVIGPDFSLSGRETAYENFLGSTQNNAGMLQFPVETDETEATEVKEEIRPSAYEGIAVVTITEAYLRVRQEASTESAVVGQMFPQTKGEIIEETEDWYHIVSGNVDGWISKAYAMTGHAAELFVKKNFDVAVTVATDVLRVRADADVEAAFLDYVKDGETFSVLEEKDGWYLIEFEPGKTGYVSGRYVTVGADLGNAMTMAEVAAFERQKELEAKAERVGGSLRGKTPASEAEVQLLAALLRHEAGPRSYEGCLAVANVVINRMHNGYWGTSMSEVIYAPGQFQYVNDGALNKFMADPGAVCIEAARDALDGLNNIGSYIFFRSAKTARYEDYAVWVNIGDNVFYKK